MPYEKPFSLGIRALRPWEQMRPYWTCPEYQIRFYKTVIGGWSISWKSDLRPPAEELADMSLEKLKEKMEAQLFMKFGWDRKGYRKEIERRKHESSDQEYHTDHDVEGTL
jgi:hypothetical protein